MAPIRSCRLCLGLGKTDVGHTCGRCQGSGDEPPTQDELARMLRNAKQVLQPAPYDWGRVHPFLSRNAAESG